MRPCLCTCGQVLYFDSFRCLSCGSIVGYDPELHTMVALRADGPLRLCHNGTEHGVCNWLVPSAGPDILCLACRLNRTIPDLSLPRNILLWGRVEAAKRRLIASLLSLGIHLQSKAVDPVRGLAFDLVSVYKDPLVTTGHFNGIVTLNIEEADDTYRQINRDQLGESTRTLLGHLRHEMGHYVWLRWIAAPDASLLLTAFRERFGDDRAPYADCLQRYYRDGAPPDWISTCISPYATVHPWEDWAETFSHYLLIYDGLETFRSCGGHSGGFRAPLWWLSQDSASLPPSLPPDPAEDEAFVQWLQNWLTISVMLNEMSLGLGQPMLYPYVIAAPVVGKLRLIRHVLKVIGAGAPGMKNMGDG